MHVGVNVSNTRPLLMVCPVFEDDSFIFVPMPNERPGAKDKTTYREICVLVPGVCELLEQLGCSTNIKVHNDPEFQGFTFGEGPRKWMLAELCPGDFIFFLASMKMVHIPSKADFLKSPKIYFETLKCLLRQNRGSDWFYGLIAQIKVSEIFAGKNEIERYKLHGKCRELDSNSEIILATNAHIKRGDQRTGDYIVIKGDKGESKEYHRALPISQGNTPLKEIQDIFYKHKLKRNRAKWFEALLNEEGTSLLLNFINSRACKTI
jgi:hypothetical protein